MNPELFHRWIAPIGLTVMLVVGVLLMLAVIRHHGRMAQWRLARAERKHPFAAPARTLIAFGVAFGAIIAFVRIAREVVEGETGPFDVRLATAAHSLDVSIVDPIMRAFSFIGSPLAVIPTVLGAFGWSIRRKDYRAALALAIVVVMNEVLNVILKDTFARPRPTIFEDLAQLHSYSFPSGHAMAAIANYGMIGIIVVRITPKYRRALEMALPFLVFMIGLSRVCLGFHWPTDVLAGFAAGGFLLLAGAITLDGLPAIGFGSEPTRSH